MSHRLKVLPSETLVGQGHTSQIGSMMIHPLLPI